MTVSVNDNLSLDPWGMGGALPGDWYDDAKMTNDQPAQSSDSTWWQDLIKFGVTRAVDNTTSRTQVQGNTDPGYFSGQNGQTYGQQYARYGNQSTPGVAGLGNLLPLIIIGAIVYAVANSKG